MNKRTRPRAHKSKTITAKPDVNVWIPVSTPNNQVQRENSTPTSALFILILEGKQGEEGCLASLNFYVKDTQHFRTCIGASSAKQTILNVLFKLHLNVRLAAPAKREVSELATFFHFRISQCCTSVIRVCVGGHRMAAVRASDPRPLVTSAATTCDPYLSSTSRAE